MKKINSFSFQGVKGAYSELAGKNLLIYLSQKMKFL